MMNKFKVGDVVKHKAGNRKMIILAIQNDTDKYACEYQVDVIPRSKDYFGARVEEHYCEFALEAWTPQDQWMLMQILGAKSE